ncbi:NAD-dependent dehydratase [Candidatus Gottesmanbacteria bacterium RBG_16_52_11]|uniref:NAD-dependent dehydratase n=1 Tax=Candidatus Gottesmanbacteria bacterium RBG_16_52_11 TaxID=1798374 RepID=A0A1F5YW19_9BACT|nr:MAG: NAD-dependent dehydratase [Candidatus Gottesmanbacteria bacterium RBG_16_52_11]
MSLRGRSVLITGGAGFIGSNLAIALVRKGAKVTVLDNLTPHQGGSLFNLKPVEDKIEIDFSDIRDEASIKRLVRGKDYIFHLARQTDHILSITNPFTDIDVNVRGTAILLEAIRYVNPETRFIYTGTRGQYGKAVKLPVGEDAPTNPRGIYEITNLTAEKIIGIYNDVHGIKSICLRLTNVYGPRSQMKHDHYGVVNWFIRLAIEDKVIPVFGDGMLKRDFLYVDDAVGAIIACAACDNCYGEIINVGDPKPETFRKLVETIVSIAKSGSWELAPFTSERKAMEPGNFASDISKIRRLSGWNPKTPLRHGLSKTIDYYRKFRKHYW